MTDNIILEAQDRSETGTSASRALRRHNDAIPAIVYGADTPPRNIHLAHKDVLKALNLERFYTQPLTLKVNGDEEQVVLKDMQRSPARPRILHMDFLRVSADTMLRVQIPLHFINEEACIGVRQQGGVIMHVVTELEIAARADQVPEYIEVDLIEAELGDIIHMSDLNLPSGASIPALAQGEQHDQPVVMVIKPRAVVEDEETDPSEGGEADTKDEEGLAEDSSGEA